MRLLIFILLLPFFAKSQIINANSYYTGRAAAGCVYLLDTFSSSHSAFSLMKIRGAYSGSSIRVRRSNDNTESDIGFSGCELDTASLKTFVGSNTGYIVTFYDQSGNGNNSTQPIPSWQAKIINSGTIYRLNNKPAWYFLGTDIKMYLPLIAGKARLDIYFVQSTSDVQYINFAKNSTAGSEYGFIATSGSGSGSLGTFGTPSLYTNGSLQTSTTRDNVYTALNGTKIITIQNAVTTAWSDAIFNGYNGFEMVGLVQEMIIWDSDQSSNRSGIVANMNYRYSIY